MYPSENPPKKLPLGLIKGLALFLFIMTIYYGPQLINQPKKNFNQAAVYPNTIIVSAIPPTSNPSPTPMIFYPANTNGYAISWPQCGSKYPEPPYDFGILGVTGGISFTHNKCLSSEFAWAQKAIYPPSFYINVDFPISINQNLLRSFHCFTGDENCIAYQYGFSLAKDAYEYAISQNAYSQVWWLDVQIMSRWSINKAVNAQVILGANSFFKSKNLTTGLSTTPYQWNTIAGDLQTQLPNWIPGMLNKASSIQYCQSGKGYSGGFVRQLAYISNGFEAVYACGR